MKLILARHGQTQANLDRVLDTLPPGYPLTAEGRRQAERLADALHDEPVVAVYASPAVRARQTAEPVAARHGLTPIELDGVQEVFLGDLEARSDPEAHELWNAIYRSWHAGHPDRRVPGGESGTDVLHRYRAALSRLAATRHPVHPNGTNGTVGAEGDGTVVVVSHGGAIRLAAAALATNVTSEFAQEHYLLNTRTVVLAPTGENGWHCLRWNDVDLPG
jgi:broad specificity phosphatase PhoE